MEKGMMERGREKGERGEGEGRKRRGGRKWGGRREKREGGKGEGRKVCVEKGAGASDAVRILTSLLPLKSKNHAVRPLYSEFDCPSRAFPVLRLLMICFTVSSGTCGRSN